MIKPKDLSIGHVSESSPSKRNSFFYIYIMATYFVASLILSDDYILGRYVKLGYNLTCRFKATLI